MPNPALIHMQSSKLQHFLGLVDVYIELGRPEIFQVEPQVTDEYRPDAYTRINGMPTMIEYQRSTVSLKKMQQKVDQFVQTHRKGKHDAKTLLVVTSIYYNLPEIPGYQIMQRALSR